LLRLCVDYQGLNQLTWKDKYPIPLLTDLLDAPQKARVYTKIDLHNTYHLVHIADGDEWKTMFCTRYGPYEWTVMPFGLSNAPLTFQQFMKKLFADLLDICVIVYLNNILIYSKNLKEHKRQVKEIQSRLKANGLCASPKKCVFHQEQVKFLGYILSPKGLQMDEEKVQVIQEWPSPR